MRLFRRRGPVLGPPPPPCCAQGWRTFQRCDLPLGHDGQHGTIIGRTTKTGGLIESVSVTYEMWGH